MFRLIASVILTVLVWSCTDLQKPNGFQTPHHETTAKALFTYSILSDLDQPEIYADQFFRRIQPTLVSQNAFLAGVFKPTHLEEFTPFSRLRSDELIIMIGWQNSTIKDAEVQLNNALPKLKQGLRHSTRYFEDSSFNRSYRRQHNSLDNNIFDRPGFYAHNIIDNDQNSSDLDQRPSREDQWEFREIAKDPSRSTTTKILFISRHNSYESWESARISDGENTSRSVSEALHQWSQDGQKMASQLLPDPSKRSR